MTDYTFYNGTYLAGREAVFNATSFPFWERKASQEVRKYTFGNIDETKPIIDEVKFCVCEVAEILYKHDQSGQSNGIQSEKVGEYSVTYTTKDSASELQSKVRSAIETWLLDTGLMYCGVM